MCVCVFIARWHQSRELVNKLLQSPQPVSGCADNLPPTTSIPSPSPPHVHCPPTCHPLPCSKNMLEVQNIALLFSVCPPPPPLVPSSNKHAHTHSLSVSLSVFLSVCVCPPHMFARISSPHMYPPLLLSGTVYVTVSAPFNHPRTTAKPGTPVRPATQKIPRSSR